MEIKILDLGCGSSKHPNSIGADINLNSEADVICDLNNSNYPFKDDCFDMVVSKQLFEHVADVETVLKEVYRICKNKAKIVIEVPHFSCFYAYGDPTHKRCFSILSFDKIALRCGFKIIVKKFTFHKALRRYKINFLANKFPINYERFWAFIFPSENLSFELEVIK
ncbi:MAG: class I SAM-dependent methyltransferase [Candidatus Omnitrophica bacterium]|nr:class I SAM-dependent methyltransferase [Candidatus Omnitrophota bacterium]